MNTLLYPADHADTRTVHLKLVTPLDQDELVHLPGTPVTRKTMLLFDPAQDSPTLTLQVADMTEAFPEPLAFEFPMNVHLARLLTTLQRHANLFTHAWMAWHDPALPEATRSATVQLLLQEIRAFLEDFKGNAQLYLTPLRPDRVFVVGEKDPSRPDSHAVMYMKHAPLSEADIDKILYEATGTTFMDIWLEDSVRKGIALFLSRARTRRYLLGLMQGGPN